MPKRYYSPYKPYQIDVANKFRPVAHEIACRALEEVRFALSRPDATAALSAGEQARLSDTGRDQELVQHFAKAVTTKYRAGLQTLEQGSVETERGVAIELLRGVLDRYRSRSDGDALDYYTRAP